MDDNVENFMGFTGANADIARRYLGMTENNFEQAVQLFFDSPDLGGEQPAVPSAPPVPASTRPPRRAPSDGGTISDDDADTDFDDQDEDSRAAALAHAADLEDDEAMARRMQEELYAGGDASSGLDADGVRAPIARTTETLVGGHDGGWGDNNEAHEDALRQFRARARPGGSSSRVGVFNQRAVPSIWDERADPDTRRQGMAEATGGASEQSSKAARLAELFRPPFEIMRQLPWDEAREAGKDETKWIIVNVQDSSLFDCQRLNRDIWKHDGIKELIKENFVFVQYSKDDPRGQSYFQYYFQYRDSADAYPHIAIIDPRTGEQVKVWSGPPIPDASDFLMQLVEFLDRYSLDASKKNPVARRKAEKPKAVDVNRLTEEEMLELALQNSLAANGTPTGPKDSDPDELTKSFTNAGKGKEKDTEEEPAAAEPSSSADDTAFSQISANNPHAEPAAGSGVTRVQIRHSNGRVVRRFNETDQVRRIYEWLKSEPLEGKAGVAFDLKGMGKDLLEHLDDTIADAGFKNGTVMVEFD